MKKCLFLVLFTFASLAFSQDHISQNNQDLNSQSISIRGSEIKGISANIEGSAYLYSKYVTGQVEGFDKKYEMRYNAYNDDVEFLKDGVAVILAKEDAYSTINFIGSYDVLKLVDYTYKDKNAKGYLFEISKKNNLSVLQRISVIFNPEILAKNSYETNVAANFKRVKDLFYFQKANSTVTEFPTNKRKLIDLFPERKEEINTYFKYTKVDFTNAADILKLATIL